MEDSEHFTPRAAPPRLVRPIAVRPRGAVSSGDPRPSRDEVRGTRWRRTTRGLYVPARVDVGVPEQRILKQSMRLDPSGAVTGWASLRLHGAAYCDGRGPGGGLAPVELITTRQLTGTKDGVGRRMRVPPEEIRLRHGIRCTSVERALADELDRVDGLREAVVLLDMVMAAELTSLRRLRRYLAGLTGRRRSRLEASLRLADEHSRSPMESRTRLVWVLDAGWDPPLCNHPVWSDDGAFLGTPDLLDPGLGIVLEYDGAAHRGRARHRRDIARLDAFRAAGIEDVTVVAGDAPRIVVSRLRAARERARARPHPGTWTVVPPGQGRARRDLDELLDARDALDQRAATPEGGKV